MLIEVTFNRTLNKILADADTDENSQHDLTSELIDPDPNLNLQTISDKDKFLFFVNYRGKPTDHFALALNKLNAPCKVIMTLNKTKSVISKLKTPVPHLLQNNVVYQISCPRCTSSYVGQTSRHLQQRFREHMGARGILRKHFEECNVSPTDNEIKIIGRARGERLLSLEALHISKRKPNLNSKDEYRSRILKLKF